MPDEENAQPATPPDDAKPAREARPRPAAQPADKAVVPAEGGGRRLAAAGAGTPSVVVVQQPPAGVQMPAVSRRKVLLIGFWSAMFSLLGAIAYTIVNNLYPRGITGFGGEVFVGTVDQLPPGGFLRNLDAKAWIMRLDDVQAERNGGQPGAILALYHKCPHLGCTVPWRPEFAFEDSRSGQTYNGWFRCPCHGSTYSFAGVRVFGPAPRSMDTFAVTIDGGNITVDTSSSAITQGGEDNASRGVVPSA